MKTTHSAVALLAGALLASPVMAADSHSGHETRPATVKTAAAQAHMGEGKVNKVEPDKNRVNITHGPIKSLGWSGMTMDFQVKNKAVLDGIKPGQQVEFDVISEGPGQFFITRIVPAK